MEILLQTLTKKILNNVYGSNVRRDILDEYVFVTYDWMDPEYDKLVEGITL